MTLLIDDVVARQLRELAHQSGKPFKQVVNEILRAGLQQRRNAKPARPYRLEPVAMGLVDDRFDLSKALQLAHHLEDEEMILIDVNLLIYAVNREAHNHKAAQNWSRSTRRATGWNVED